MTLGAPGENRYAWNVDKLLVWVPTSESLTENGNNTCAWWPVMMVTPGEDPSVDVSFLTWRGYEIERSC